MYKWLAKTLPLILFQTGFMNLDIMNYRFLTTEIISRALYIFRCFVTTSSVKLVLVTVQIFVYKVNLEIIFFEQENYFEPLTSFLHEADCFSVKKLWFDTKKGLTSRKIYLYFLDFDTCMKLCAFPAFVSKTEIQLHWSSKGVRVPEFLIAYGAAFCQTHNSKTHQGSWDVTIRTLQSNLNVFRNGRENPGSIIESAKGLHHAFNK